MGDKKTVEDPIQYQEAQLLIYDWITSIMQKNNYSQVKMAAISKINRPNLAKFISHIRDGRIDELNFMPSSISLLNISLATNEPLPVISKKKAAAIRKKLKTQKSAK